MIKVQKPWQTLTFKWLSVRCCQTFSQIIFNLISVNSNWQVINRKKEKIFRSCKHKPKTLHFMNTQFVMTGFVAFAALSMLEIARRKHAVTHVVIVFDILHIWMRATERYSMWSTNNTKITYKLKPRVLTKKRKIKQTIYKSDITNLSCSTFQLGASLSLIRSRSFTFTLDSFLSSLFSALFSVALTSISEP